jgi:hypothetical protein
MKEILKLLDSQITDKEFLREIANSQLLKACKEKGFPNLKAYGLIKYPNKENETSE